MSSPTTIMANFKGGCYCAPQLSQVDFESTSRKMQAGIATPHVVRQLPYETAEPMNGVATRTENGNFGFYNYCRCTPLPVKPRHETLYQPHLICTVYLSTLSIRHSRKTNLTARTPCNRLTKLVSLSLIGAASAPHLTDLTRTRSIHIDERLLRIEPDIKIQGQDG